MPGMLSERIAALRKERGLTQEQLGKMVGVSYQAVGKWEKGGAPDVELAGCHYRRALWFRERGTDQYRGH
ncbi:MAG: helix-turn-helix domain-containing protein [Lachnospiraceae bacterium]|nr:helix-turn-helix domain-containing protein [Lachnospiraceae bacterium]